MALIEKGQEEPSISDSSKSSAPLSPPSEAGVSKLAMATDEAPPSYPKIPPPPSEHPPPYTPYGGQTAALLPSADAASRSNAQSGAARNRAANVVHPPVLRTKRAVNLGVKKYGQYITVRNVLLAIGGLIVLALFIHLIRWSNRSDHAMSDTSQLPGTKPLEVHWQALGEYNQSLERLSYDKSADRVILSQYYRGQSLLTCESVDLDNHLNGFRKIKHSVSKTFAQCVCYTERAYCCATNADSRHHQTECYLQEKDEIIRSVAVMFDPAGDWQSLVDGQRLILLHNHQRNALLDLRYERVLKIEENRLPAKYVSVGFFFPMDSADELEELVRNDDEFRICEHLRTTSGDYALKDELCKSTPFTVEFELPKVKFCSNPLYTVVIQYGHLNGESQTLTWHLRVKYDSSPDVYSASESLAADRDQLLLDCNDREVDVFVLGTYELQRFTIALPDLRSEHFIQTRAV